MPPTELLHPAYLAGLWAIALPIALHFIRRRLGKPVPLPSLFFLRASAHATRNHWLRRWLVLLLRAVVIALLAAAFARPYLQKFWTGGRATIVVVDRSFSMQAGRRWSDALAWAREQLGTPGRDERAGVLLSGRQPEWLVPLGDDAPAAARALAALEPGWECAHVEDALRLAADTLAGNTARERRIVFVGDHQRVSWTGAQFDRLLPAGVAVEFAPVAAPVTDQLALARPAVRRDTSGTIVAEVQVTSYAAGTARRTLRVFGEDGLAALDESTVALAPGEMRAVQFTLPGATKARWLRFALGEDSASADDVAYALCPEPPVTGAAAVLLDAAPAGANDFVGAALAAAAEVPPGFTVRAPPATVWPPGSVALLRNAASFEGERRRRLEAFLAAGGRALVLVDAAVAASPWWKNHGIVLSPGDEAVRKWRVRDWALDEPLVAEQAENGLRTLLGWEFRRGWKLGREAAEPIAFWQDDSVAIGTLSVGAGRLVVCGFAADRRDGDWPIAGGFLPFLHRTLRHLATQRAAEAPTPALYVGEAIALPEGTGEWRALTGPAAASPAAAASGSITPARPGVYAFAQGERSHLWAVNVVPEESDLAPWAQGQPWRNLVNPVRPAEQAESARRALAADDAEQRSGLWWWCLAAMALALLAEITLANRTVR
ncbi:MAG TPA: BatA and WFA domain-containing protein [Opitutaceae bacterium]|nr:BatA and WFA domain-containing protein [Opitutaceae bacterium]